MAAQYYLTTGNQKIGPLSEKAIHDGIRAGKISLFDMIYNHQSSEWVMLMQHPDFSDLDSGSDDDSSSQHQGHLAVGLISDRMDDEHTLVPANILADNFPSLEPVYWYEKDNTSKRLKYLDVLSLIHAHKLSEHSMLAKQPTGPWQRLIDWDEFSPASLEKYKQASAVNLPDVNIRRKFPRYTVGSVFVAIAQNKGFQVFCPDISKSGLAFLVREPKCGIKDEVILKFADKVTENKFDAKGVVVSVRKVRLPGSEQIYLRYGVKFTHLSENGKAFIKASALNDEA